MAGIYIHIPFCRQACHYCDFHFSTSLKNKPEIVTAINKELNLRKNYLPEKPMIETIYFGGGTPSLLDEKELDSIFETIYRNFSIAANPEITLEANPDDLSLQKLTALKHSPVNRLSIGIQSFFEEDLKWMNRAHNAKQATVVLQNALQAGFGNLTADLIFGFPLLSDLKWKKNIEQMLQSGIRHLSAYCMTVEKGTPLAGFIKQKKQQPMDEEQAGRQFLFLMDRMAAEGWEQYEISNYAKNACYSKHNTNYWRGIPYLGVGPSAHSFDGKTRQWNTRVNSRYLQNMAEGKPAFQQEVLTLKNQYDEYIMTALRTQWGIQLAVVKERFGENALAALSQKAESLVKTEWVKLTDDAIKLTTKGKLFADKISVELFE